MSTETSYSNERLAEAARYALMRRLMPAIRHHIAGSLQPIGMMSAMLEKRIQAATPDIVQLGKNAQALTAVTREAAATSLNLMAWLAPRDNDLVAVNSAIEESFSMVATELSFRGFSLVVDTADASAKLPRGVLRSVFTASLIALTDSAKGVANVVVSSSQEAGSTLLKISIVKDRTTEPGMVQNPMSSYRALQWDDVQALAAAEGAQLHLAPDSVQIAYLPTPLGIA